MLPRSLLKRVFILPKAILPRQRNSSSRCRISRRAANKPNSSSICISKAHWDQATALALRVFETDEKNFGPMQKVVEALLQSGQDEKALEILDRSRVPMIDAGEHEAVGRLLNELAVAMPDRLEPREWLVDLYGRTSDSFHLSDALGHLGDVLVANRQLERAKKTFEQLAEREPENDSARRKLDGVIRRMQGLAPEEAPEVPEQPLLPTDFQRSPVVKLRSEDEEPAPEAQAKSAGLPGEPPLDEETQKFISQSLTDVDLFASYGLTQKAIGLLEAILRRAPRHTPTLEKLLDFVLGAGDDRRTAELAAQLEQIHHATGDKRSAERFGELRRRFQRAAGLSDEDLAIATAAAMPASKETSVAETHEVTIPEVPAEPAAEGATASPVQGAESAPVEVNASPSPEVQEVDLSDEWATLLKESHHGEAKVEAPASKPAKGTPEPPSRPEPTPVEEFSISGAPPAVPPAEVTSKATPIPLEPESLAATSGKSAAGNRAKGIPASGKPQKPAKSDEPEFEVAQDFELVLEPEPLVPAYD